MTITSTRRGFVDARQLGSNGQSLTKRMAVKAGVPGAGSIPDEAELFLGFTSTQQAALGESVIANFESLPGVTNQWPAGYFANGTTMHLSHIFEDLEAWYAATHRQRAGFAFSPRVDGSVKPGRLTLPEGRAHVESLAQVEADFESFGFVGHSSSMQPVPRLSEPVTDNYGTDYPTGTAVPERADFNTLDNPFLYSSNPELDHWSNEPAAGLHFVVFVPTSSMFDLIREAMDGQYTPGGSLGTGAAHSPFNNVLQTTHRQNFLVPPRAAPRLSARRTDDLRSRTDFSEKRSGLGSRQYETPTGSRTRATRWRGGRIPDRPGVVHAPLLYQSLAPARVRPSQCLHRRLRGSHVGLVRVAKLGGSGGSDEASFPVSCLGRVGKIFGGLVSVAVLPGGRAAGTHDPVDFTL